MKKFLPIIIFTLGLVTILGGAFWIIRGNKTAPKEEEKTVQLSPDKWPFVSLTPSEDGHWLKLKIDNIKVDLPTLDYELIYEVADGRTQGIPGTISLDGQTSIDRELLLGSESSGKFRYDEGVEKGTLTLRFRNSKGKLASKLETKFHLQTGDKTLTSIDEKFNYSLNKPVRKTYFVIMETFSVIGERGSIELGPYGIFTSDKKSHPGKVELGSGNIYIWNAGWQKLESGLSSNVGIFMSSTQQ